MWASPAASRSPVWASPAASGFISSASSPKVSPSTALPDLDRGALRVSTTLWNPFEGLVFVNDLNAAEVRDLAQALEPSLEDLCGSDHLGQRVTRALYNDGWRVHLN